MNEWEIDEAVRRHAAHSVLGKAALFLSEFRHEVNQHSDGWAYWKPPLKSAARLIAIVQGKAPATESELIKALTPIKSFYGRLGYKAGLKMPHVEGLSAQGSKPATPTAISAEKRTSRSLNARALEVILAVQALRKFAICDGWIHEGSGGWMDRVKNYWAQLPDAVMNEAGLHKNVLDLNLALDFHVTDEMMSAKPRALQAKFLL